ncbi:hypothetical protein D3C83_181550 [compost metagenome]
MKIARETLITIRKVKVGMRPAVAACCRLSTMPTMPLIWRTPISELRLSRLENVW